MNRFEWLLACIALSMLTACGDDEAGYGPVVKSDQSIRDAGLASGLCQSNQECSIGHECLLGQCSMVPVEPISAEEQVEDADSADDWADSTVASASELSFFGPC